MFIQVKNIFVFWREYFVEGTTCGPWTRGRLSWVCFSMIIVLTHFNSWRPPVYLIIPAGFYARGQSIHCGRSGWWKICFTRNMRWWSKQRRRSNRCQWFYELFPLFICVQIAGSQSFLPVLGRTRCKIISLVYLLNHTPSHLLLVSPHQPLTIPNCHF